MQRLVYEWICVGCERDLTIEQALICGDFHDGKPLAVAPLCESCMDAHLAVTHKPVMREWVQ